MGSALAESRADCTRLPNCSMWVQSEGRKSEREREREREREGEREREREREREGEGERELFLQVTYFVYTSNTHQRVWQAQMGIRL